MKQATKKEGKQRKIDTVKSLSEKLAKTKALFIADYRGLTHQQLETLRKALKKVEAEYVVVKNSLLHIASNSLEPRTLVPKGASSAYNLEPGDLVGPSAVLLSYADEITPLKELFKTIKALSLPKVKFGFISGKKYSPEEVTIIAKLPAQEVLRGQLVSQLSSPLYGLAHSLNYNLQKLVQVLGVIRK